MTKKIYYKNETELAELTKRIGFEIIGSGNEFGLNYIEIKLK